MSRRREIGTPAVSSCQPRYGTKPTPGRKTRGPEVAAVALAIGYQLMAWQKMVLDIGLELLDDGTPAYREVIITCPRQVGKTVLTLSWELHRCIMWDGGPQNVAYTCQTGHDAREKLLQDQLPLLEAKDAPIREAIERIHRANGSEGVSFSNGSRLSILNSGEDAGHGRIYSLAIIDEAFADFDDRREQSLLPSMITKRDAQVVILSTAGTEKSAFLKRKLDLGRSCVANNENEGVAFFEWSAAPEADPADPKTWASCIPSLGITIDERSLRHSQRTMPPAQFARAFLNQWTASDERVLPAITWNAVCSDTVAPEGKFVLALDVPPDRSSASVCVADDSGRVELIHQASGLGTVVEVVTAISKKWSADVVVDGFGPAASLIGELESEGVTVRSYTTREMTSACAKLYDAVADKKIEIRRHEALDLAAGAARRRQVGDSWLWGRKDSAENVSPLVSCTLAFDAASNLSDGSDVWAFVGPGAGEW
jgi:hypothetical protein